MTNSTCDCSDDGSGFAVPVPFNFIMIVILISLSAMFSGLTLGLLSLDKIGGYMIYILMIDVIFF